jgi:DNA-binding XRE family transcriptional regulator
MANYSEAPPFHSGHITTLRMRNGWTKAQLARIVHVSRDTIERLETNHAKRPSMLLLNALADAFGCKVADFFQPQPIRRKSARRGRP